MPGVALAGLRGTLVEQVAALVAARTGWRIWRPGGGEPPAPDSGVIYLGWEAFRSHGSGAGVFRVLLVAPWSLRLQRIMSEGGIDALQAAGIAANQAQEEDRRARELGWSGAEDPEGYHLILNTGRLSAEQAACVIVWAANMGTPAPTGRRRRSRRRGRGRREGALSQAGAAVASGPGPAADGLAAPKAEPPAGSAGGLKPVEPTSSGADGARVVQAPNATAILPQPVHHPRPRGTRPAFAHPSEEEFARVLDFYRVEWQYEPTTFPLEWDEKGNVTLAFTPDFYIPAWDLYVELTTMKQSLVNRKNRKIRRLRELYPNVRIKTFYGRDFERLLRKFGREEVLQPAGVNGAGGGGHAASAAVEPPRDVQAVQAEGQEPPGSDPEPPDGPRAPDGGQAASAVWGDGAAEASGTPDGHSGQGAEQALGPVGAEQAAATDEVGRSDGRARRRAGRRPGARRRSRPRRASTEAGG